MEVIFNYANIVSLGICLCIGYILKNIIPAKKINKYIPLILAAIGVSIAVWDQRGISPEIILTGLISGLMAVGLYETFRNFIEVKKNEKDSSKTN